MIILSFFFLVKPPFPSLTANKYDRSSGKIKIIPNRWNSFLYWTGVLKNLICLNICARLFIPLWQTTLKWICFCHRAINSLGHEAHFPTQTHVLWSWFKVGSFWETWLNFISFLLSLNERISIFKSENDKFWLTFAMRSMTEIFLACCCFIGSDTDIWVPKLVHKRKIIFLFCFF